MAATARHLAVVEPLPAPPPMSEAEADAIELELSKLIIMCGPGDPYAARITRHLRIVRD